MSSQPSALRAPNRPPDRIRYCERCGISFLWSSEEQVAQDDAAPTPPARCPGCRVLLPPPGRERGLVKWYNVRKRFGFIVRKEQPELFVHGSEVSGGRLHPGDLVEFAVGENERGLAAKAVTVLAHTDPPVPD